MLHLLTTLIQVAATSANSRFCCSSQETQGTSISAPQPTWEELTPFHFVCSSRKQDTKRFHLRLTRYNIYTVKYSVDWCFTLDAL